MVNNEKNGEDTEWDESGNIKHQINYSNGKFNGDYKLWYSNGQIQLHF